MSDTELRRLERSVVAAPDDPAIRWQLVHALERTGARTRRVLELMSLARAGDRSALEQVSSRIVRAHRTAPLARRSGIRRAERVRQVVFSESLVDACWSDELVVLTGSQEIVAFDLGSMREAWRVAAGRSAKPLLAGDVVCSETGRWRRLNVGTGDEIATCASQLALDKLFDSGTGVHVGALLCDWRRGPGRGVVGVDIQDDFGQVLWRHAPNTEWQSITAAAGRVFVLRNRAIEAVAAQDGGPLWTARGPEVPSVTRGSYSSEPHELLADERGLVVVVSKGANLGMVQLGLSEREATTGAVRWSTDLAAEILGAEFNGRSLDGDPCTSVRLAANAVIIPIVDEQNTVSLLALDREGGKRRWIAPLARKREVAHDRYRDRWCLALGHDVAYFGLQRARDQLEVLALDLDTGSRRFSKGVRLDAPQPQSGHLLGHELVPLDGALAIVARFENATVIAQLEG